MREWWQREGKRSGAGGGGGGLQAAETGGGRNDRGPSSSRPLANPCTAPTHLAPVCRSSINRLQGSSGRYVLTDCADWRAQGGLYTSTTRGEDPKRICLLGLTEGTNRVHADSVNFTLEMYRLRAPAGAYERLMALRGSYVAGLPARAPLNKAVRTAVTDMQLQPVQAGSFLRQDAEFREAVLAGFRPGSAAAALRGDTALTDLCGREEGLARAILLHDSGAGTGAAEVDAARSAAADADADAEEEGAAERKAPPERRADDDRLGDGPDGDEDGGSGLAEGAEETGARSAGAGAVGAARAGAGGAAVPADGAASGGWHHLRWSNRPPRLVAGAGVPRASAGSRQVEAAAAAIAQQATKANFARAAARAAAGLASAGIAPMPLAPPHQGGAAAAPAATRAVAFPATTRAAAAPVATQAAVAPPAGSVTAAHPLAVAGCGLPKILPQWPAPGAGTGGHKSSAGGAASAVAAAAAAAPAAAAGVLACYAPCVPAQPPVHHWNTAWGTATIGNVKAALAQQPRTGPAEAAVVQAEGRARAALEAERARAALEVERARAALEAEQELAALEAERGIPPGGQPDDLSGTKRRRPEGLASTSGPCGGRPRFGGQ